MLVTDVSMRVDPIYGQITRRWLDHPEEMNAAFAKAWYKLLHRDMGPVSRYLGPVGRRAAALAGPGARRRPRARRRGGHRRAEGQGARTPGCRCPQLVKTAWSSASSFRGTDKRGGANGARIRLEPQRNWEANEPSELAKVLPVLEKIQQDFNAASGGKKVSLADLIVLAGSAAIEKAAKDGGLRDHGALRAGSHRRLAGEHRRGVVRSARAAGRRIPQLRAARREDARWSSCWSRRRTCSTSPLRR